MKVCASRFTAYCLVQEKSESSSPTGGFTNTWTDRCNIYAQVVQRDADERFDHEAIETQRAVNFYAKYRSDIVNTDRIVLDGLNHNIRSITRVDKEGKSKYRGIYMKIEADEGVFDSA